MYVYEYFNIYVSTRLHYRAVAELNVIHQFKKWLRRICVFLGLVYFIFLFF